MFRFSHDAIEIVFALRCGFMVPVPFNGNFKVCLLALTAAVIVATS